MAKNNKALIGIIAGVCVAVVIAVSAVVIINNNKPKTEDGDSSSNESTKVVTADELLKTTPSAEVAYGDFDKMSTLAKDIQNGKMTGQIVSIDGLVNHPGQEYSVVEQNASGTTKIGTVFNIDDSSEYPADGSHITIVAKVVEVSPMNFQLVTLKNFIKEK